MKIIFISILITMTTASAFGFPTPPFNALEQSQLKTINDTDALQYNFELSRPGYELPQFFMTEAAL